MFRGKIASDAVHQGIFCDADELNFVELDFEKIPQNINSDKLHGQAESKKLLWLFLDRIQDPMNFGAILRTCHFMGVDSVVTTNKERYMR